MCKHARLLCRSVVQMAPAVDPPNASTMTPLFLSPTLPHSFRLWSNTSFCRRSTSTVRRTTSPSVNRIVRACVERPAWKNAPVDVDFAKDEQLQILEEHLDLAIDNENYQRASEIRDKLLRLQSGAYVAVLSANMKFYQAFQNASIVDMASCWLQDNSVTCKHPLGPIATGYLDIINSFGMLFSLGIPNLDIRNVRISMRGTVAVVTCEECASEWEEETHQDMTMCAINIFVKRNGQWYLTHHSSMQVLGKEN